jgi:hypothetical protein
MKNPPRAGDQIKLKAAEYLIGGAEKVLPIRGQGEPIDLSDMPEEKPTDDVEKDLGDLTASKPFDNLNGIRGWLSLWVIALVVLPFTILYRTVADIRLLTSGEFRDQIASEYVYQIAPAESYRSATRLIAFTVVTDAAILAGSVWINFLFFRKKRIFPRYMMRYLVALICLPFTYALVAPSIVLHDPEGSAYCAQVVQALIPALIWIPYLRKSRRVKATFVL